METVNSIQDMQKPQIQTPMVGVGVMIFNNEGKILLGKRRGSHGAGEYAFPGGHLEYMESFENCAVRETKEECGIEIDHIEFLYLTNLVKYAPKHYVHIGLVAKWKQGVPQVLEPGHEESWAWYGLDNLPAPLFETCQLAIDSYKNEWHYKSIAA